MTFKKLHSLIQTQLPLIIKMLLVFSIAILLRATVYTYTNGVTSSGKYLLPDSCGYYQVAVNLANGDGYVQHPGQEPYYFREPGTIYFYAANVALYKIITGSSVVEPSFGDKGWPQDRDNERVIKLIRLSQAILQAITLVLFYLLLRQFFSNVFSFLVAVLVSLWPPLAFFSENLLRENLLLGVLMGMAWTFSSHIQKPAYWKLAVIGIFWGVCALTLQVYMLIGPFLVLFIFLKTKQVLPTAKQGAAIFLLFVLTVSPWLYKVYSFYPDIRIVKSMGCALTMDRVAATRALQYAKEHIPRNTPVYEALDHHQTPPKDSVSPGDEVLAIPVYGLSTREIFRRTFNGDLRQTARKLTQKYGAPSIYVKARICADRLVNFFYLPGYMTGMGPPGPRENPIPYDYRHMVGVTYVSAVLGVFSIIGL